MWILPGFFINIVTEIAIIKSLDSSLMLYIPVKHLILFSLHIPVAENFKVEESLRGVKEGTIKDTPTKKSYAFTIR